MSVGVFIFLFLFGLVAITTFFYIAANNIQIISEDSDTDEVFSKQEKASITINANTLNDAESITIRVAMNNFIENLQDSGLGDDEHGKKLVSLYIANAKSVLTKLNEESPKE